MARAGRSASSGCALDVGADGDGGRGGRGGGRGGLGGGRERGSNGSPRTPPYDPRRSYRTSAEAFRKTLQEWKRLSSSSSFTAVSRSGGSGSSTVGGGGAGSGAGDGGAGAGAGAGGAGGDNISGKKKGKKKSLHCPPDSSPADAEAFLNDLLDHCQTVATKATADFQANIYVNKVFKCIQDDLRAREQQGQLFPTIRKRMTTIKELMHCNGTESLV